MNLKKNMSPLRTALIYAVFGFLWILITDVFVEITNNPAATLDYITTQTLKGWLFVFVSASLIYFLLRRDMKALQAQQKHTSYQAGLVEDVSDAVISTDLKFHILSWNAAAEHLYGWKASEVLGHVMAEFVQNEYISAPREEIIQIAMQQGRWKGQISQNHKDGRRFFVSTALSLIKDEDGQPIGFVAVNHDITEIKRAQEEAAMLARFPSENPNPVMRVDLDGRLAYANQASAPLLELWGCQVNEHLPQEYIKRIAGSALENTNMIDLQCGRRTFLMAITPVYGENYVNIYATDITRRKEAEELLQRSEQNYRDLLEQASDGIFITDPQGRYVLVNQAACDLVRYSREELLSMELHELVAPEDLQKQPLRLDELRMGKTLIVERIFLRKDGTKIQCELSAKMLPDGRFQFLVRDITERKQVEEKLRESQLKLQSIIDYSPALISIKDLSGNVILANQSFSDLDAPPLNELIGRNVFDIFPAELAQELWNNDLAALQADRPVRSEESVKHKDGTWHTYWTVKFPIYLESDQPFGICAISNDITERKRVEKALEESERFARATVDALSAHIAILDENGVILAVNHAWRKFSLENSPNNLQLDVYEGVNYLSVCEAASGPNSEEAAIMAAGIRAVINGEREEFLLEYPCHSPLENRWFVARVTRFHGTGDLRIVIDHENVTKRKQAEELIQQYANQLELRVNERTAELIRANRTKDEFLANMSHELRTPLNGILGFSETLLEEIRGPLNEKQQQAVGLILSSGQHLLELINDILDLSKVESGKIELQHEDILVNDICRSSLNFIKQLANKKQISVEYSPFADAITIHADRKRIKQVLVNLLNNAVKFTPEGGSVILEAQTDEENEFMRFSVTDTGIGITQEDQKKLFNPFVQLESGLSRQYEGTGLGLSLTKKFVELHGGSVELQSEPGKGSCFSFILPWNRTMRLNMAPNPQQAPKDAPHSRAAITSTSRGKILLAEDNKDNMLIIQDYLEAFGFEVIVATDGSKVLAKAQQFLPDLILMDVQMPIIDGIEVTRLLRSNPRFAAAPIIALTALAMPGDRERCLEAGMNDYLSKPVNLTGLKLRIETFLDHHPNE